MFGDLEHLLQSEVFSRLQLSVNCTPLAWFSIFAMRSELLETVINAVEQHFVVDMLALCQEILVDSFSFKVILINFIKFKKAIWLSAV